MDLFLRAEALFADPHWGRLLDGMPPDAALLAYYTALGLDAETCSALLAASHAPEGDLDATLTHASANMNAGEVTRRVMEAVNISDLWAIGIIKRIAETERYAAQARLNAVRLGLELRDRIKPSAATQSGARLILDGDALLALRGQISAQINENGRVLHIVRDDDAAAV